MSEANSKLIIIAETAFNHEGNLSYLLDLIEAIAESGVTHIKFQVLIDCDEFVSSSSESYDVVKSWCFSEVEWIDIFIRAEEKGLRLFLMPLDTKAVKLCERATVDFVEIHSVSFNDRHLQTLVNKNLQNKKLVFGLGGRTSDEIESLKNGYSEDKLVLMHGFQAFPSELEDVKLARLKYLQESFPTSVLGYADHSAPNIIDATYSSIYAYHLGARIFEKHVTLELERTDSQSAFTPKQLAKYVKEMHRFERIINESNESAFSFTEKENTYRNRQKQVVASQKIEVGEILTSNNIVLKMHSTTGGEFCLNDMINCVAKRNYNKDEVIFKDDDER